METGNLFSVSIVTVYCLWRQVQAERMLDKNLVCAQPHWNESLGRSTVCREELVQGVDGLRNHHVRPTSAIRNAVKRPIPVCLHQHVAVWFSQMHVWVGMCMCVCKHAPFSWVAGCWLPVMNENESGSLNEVSSSAARIYSATALLLSIARWFHRHE